MIRRECVPIQLLMDVENHLNITWDDRATNEKICGLIASATAYLDGKGGYEMDYDADGLPRTLMMEYIRYARDEALDVFENNYTSMIIAMQNESMVNAYVDSAEQTIKSDNTKL